MKQLLLRQPLWLSVAVEMAAVAEALPPEWSAEMVPPGQYHDRDGRAAVAVAAEVVYRDDTAGAVASEMAAISRAVKVQSSAARNDAERGQQDGWLLMAHDA